MKILFICPRLPYPPIKGDRLRAYYQIRELSKNHKITLISFSEDKESIEDPKVMKKFCEKIIIIPHNRSIAIGNIVYHLFTSLPLQCAFYQAQKMKEAITKELKEHNFDIIHIQLARMMPYVMCFKPSGINIPILLDFIDSLSLNMYNRLNREGPLLKPFFFYEWYKMKKYEKKLAYFFDCAIITSWVDRQILPYSKKVEVVPIGVDFERFSYTPITNREPSTIIFSGNMNYFPNVDAILFFSRYIYLKIKRAIPEVKFRIVGANPSSKILKIGRFDKSIEIVGFVENVAQYLNKATIAIAPILSGSGIQTKVLEALATGTPVVATTLATQAIAVRPQQDIIIADSPDHFASAIISLFKNSELRQRLSINGRKLIEEKYSWSGIARRLEEIYQKTINTFNRNISARNNFFKFSASQ